MHFHASYSLILILFGIFDTTKPWRKREKVSLNSKVAQNPRHVISLVQRWMSVLKILTFAISGLCDA